MQIRNFTDADYPFIVAIHNSLNIVWPEASRDPRAWMDADSNRSTKCHFKRFVAEADGKVVGAASCGNRLDDYQPQKFYVNVEVLEAYRCHGIGTGLYDRLVEELRPFEPKVLRTDILVNQIQSYPFVQKRGFREVWRETPVHIGVDDFDSSPYGNLERQLVDEDIHITTLHDLAGDTGRDQKAYDLYMALAKDVPSEYAEFTPSPFEDWLQWCLYDPGSELNGYFVALHGENYIAWHDLYRDAGSNALLGGLLGTLPAYRQKRIGLALMLRAIAFARESHLQTFKTCTAITNTRMQTLFDKLGFTRDPEWLQCQKDL